MRRSSSPFDCARVTGKITVPDKVESRWRCTVTGPTGMASPRFWRSVAVAKGGSVASLRCPPSLMMPSRKAMEEICPSPTARIDMTMRIDPSVMPDWSKCGTALGFISAAAA